MKRIVFTILLSITLVLPGAVLAQAEKPAAARADAAEPKAGKRSASRAAVDARDCLKFPTNMEIHRCALKYR